MKALPRRCQPSAQSKLALLDIPSSVLPDDKQTELRLALVDLLVSAARDLGRSEGGDDAREAHRDRLARRRVKPSRRSRGRYAAPPWPPSHRAVPSTSSRQCSITSSANLSGRQS